MIRCRTVIALAFVVPALAAPAGAQIVAPRIYPKVETANPFLPDSSLPSPGFWQDSRRLRQRIDRARDAGLISRREARQLRRQAGLIAVHAGSQRRGGLSSPQRTELDSLARAIDSVIPPAPTSDD